MSSLHERTDTYADHSVGRFLREFTAECGGERQSVEDPRCETEEIDQPFDVTRQTQRDGNQTLERADSNTAPDTERTTSKTTPGIGVNLRL